MAMADTSTTTAAERWELDRRGSHLGFSIRHLWGLLTVSGRFDDFAGTLTVDRDGARRIGLEVEAASVDTGNAQRDDHLRSGDFLAAADHPLIRFESTEVADEAPRRLRVRGTVEAAGRTTGVRFHADVVECEDAIELRAVAVVDPRELGMTWSPLGTVRGPATVTAIARLRRASPRPLGSAS